MFESIQLTIHHDFYEQHVLLHLIERHYGWQFNVGMHVRVKVTEVTPVTGGILVKWTEGGLQGDHPRRKGQNHAKKSIGKLATVPRGRKTSNGKRRGAKGRDGKPKDADHA